MKNLGEAEIILVDYHSVGPNLAATRVKYISYQFGSGGPVQYQQCQIDPRPLNSYIGLFFEWGYKKRSFK